jgi:hypothetical protein
VQSILTLRVSPTTRCRSFRGLALREVVRGSQSLRSGDALTAFGGGLHYAGPGSPDPMTTARLDSPGRLLCSRSASPSGRSTGRSERSKYTDSGPKGTPHDYCLSFGRGGARPGGCGERGILAYPPA